VSHQLSLNEWIQPGHLQPDAIKAYRQAFISHPARLLVLKRVLLDSEADKLSRFLSHEARFELAYALYSRKIKDGNIPGVSAAAWLEAEENERFYRFSDYAGLLDESHSSSNERVFRRFFSALRSSEFKHFFEEIAGVELGSTPLINAYSYRSGDFLRHHTDDVKSKRLSFVFYLSPHWERRFGGLLHVIDHAGEVTEVNPDYNSLVLFDVAANANHFINRVEPCAGDRARLTISGWFLTPQQVADSAKL
jgi:Rps23 Pro-64 3,4-dihydroxylase Tpa1-like proline 4-hydroxylase